MIQLRLNIKSRAPLKILCLGSHSDDIEIGCGGTILHLLQQYPSSECDWVVLSASGVRETEARRSAGLFAGSQLKSSRIKAFPDGFMPYVGSEVKTFFENELKTLSPNLIFTHYGHDAHQDHRLISELTWNTFRNHLILEYEIPKYDGDFGRPSAFVPLEKEVCNKKVHYLMDVFESQRIKPWFEPETFLGMLRIRGMECNAASGYAEAFYCRKLVL